MYLIFENMQVNLMRTCVVFIPSSVNRAHSFVSHFLCNGEYACQDLLVFFATFRMIRYNFNGVVYFNPAFSLWLDGKTLHSIGCILCLHSTTASNSMVFFLTVKLYSMFPVLNWTAINSINNKNQISNFTF